MAKVTISSAQELLDIKGNALGATDWLEISQERINLFADATNDHQWIHVDEEKAKKGPFGTTIAHGYLTLSLAAFFVENLVEFTNIKMIVNYGLDKVRFTAPVPVGSKIRGNGEIVEVEKKDGGYNIKIALTIEAEGQDRPVCVIETLARLVFA